MDAGGRRHPDGMTTGGRRFRDYFIGYRTTTRLVEVADAGDRTFVSVHVTGGFPGGETGSTFDIRFAGDRSPR